MYGCTFHRNCKARLRLVLGLDRIWRLYRNKQAHSKEKQDLKQWRGIHPDIREPVDELCLEGKGQKGIMTALRKKHGGNADLMSKMPSKAQIKYRKMTLSKKKKHEPIISLGDVYYWGQDAQRYVTTKEALWGITNPFQVIVLKVQFVYTFVYPEPSHELTITM